MTLVRAVPLRNENGAIRGWVGMNTDLTQPLVGHQDCKMGRSGRLR
jgi:hypothetical protein